MQAKRQWIWLLVGVLCAMLGLYGVVSFNRFVLMSLPLGVRMIVMPAIYWLIAVIPLIVMLVSKDKFMDYGFSRSHVFTQILVGVLVGTAMSLMLTLLPHLFGFGAYVDNNKRYQYFWQFIYEFFYCIAAIGFVEEFVFRGFVYGKLKKITQKRSNSDYWIIDSFRGISSV